MPREVHSREAILDTAYGLVIRDGFHTISYNGLAREVGIKPQSMYRYVRNIDDLRAAIIARMLTGLNDAVEASMTGLEGKDALRAVAQTLHGQYHQSSHFQDTFSSLQAYKQEPEVRAQLDRLRMFSQCIISRYTKDRAEIMRRQQLFIGFIYGDAGILASGFLPKVPDDAQKRNFDTTIEQIIALITAAEA